MTELVIFKTNFKVPLFLLFHTFSATGAEEIGLSRVDSKLSPRLRFPFFVKTFSPYILQINNFFSSFLQSTVRALEEVMGGKLGEELQKRLWKMLGIVLKPHIATTFNYK